MYLLKVISMKTLFKNLCIVGVLKVNDVNRIIRIQIRIRQRHGSADSDPDLHQYVMDPEH
jgi:hypothetical protein